MTEPRTYFIYLLAATTTNGLEERPRLMHPFLSPVDCSIHSYKTQSGCILYKFLDDVYFLLAPGGREEEIKAQYSGCCPLWLKIVMRDEYVAPENISKGLRGSSTLQIDGNNCFATGGGNLVVFSPHGIHISRKDEGTWGANSFERDVEKSMECYLLALSYQKKTETLLQSAIDKPKKMVAVRDRMCDFDLKYFFANPVRMEVFETYALWRMTAQHCGIKELHGEIKDKIQELAVIIENRRRRFFDVFFTIVGTLLSAASLLVALKSFSQ